MLARAVVRLASRCTSARWATVPASVTTAPVGIATTTGVGLAVLANYSNAGYSTVFSSGADSLAFGISELSNYMDRAGNAANAVANSLKRRWEDNDQKVIMSIIGANVLVFAMWRVAPARIMTRLVLFVSRGGATSQWKSSCR